MQPLYTVERPGFRKLLATHDSKYQLPSRRHFAEQELPRWYTEVREKHVMPKLSKLTFFSATTDLWTSAAKHPYLSLTVHFISDEWSLETVCLDTAPLFMDTHGAEPGRGIPRYIVELESQSRQAGFHYYRQWVQFHLCI